MNQTIESNLKHLFEQWAGEPADLILSLTRTASNRQYYRLQGSTKVAIGTYGPDLKENKAFVVFSKHFHAKGLAVPQIYAVDEAAQIYLQEDLGATTLFSFLLQKGEDFPDNLLAIYKKVVTKLAQLQIQGGEGLDYTYCYPRDTFDRQSMQWDLNTFKYFFLKLSGVTFDEQALQEDFDRLLDFLLTADCSHFMFRDFQSRNIMLLKGEPYFIDYQGGRKGALQYDLASLLFQPKAAIPAATRELLLEHYLDAVNEFIAVDQDTFKSYFYGYALIRRIQALGTYGLRGLHEHRAYFLNSIPIALGHIDWILSETNLPIELPEIKKTIDLLKSTGRFEQTKQSSNAASLLTVTINSFSYKRAIPTDSSGNGGGFVFDCRFLNNPGRYEPYKKITGRDQAVIDFLEKHSNIQDYLNNIYHIVDKAVENYLERSFTHLMVSFGCTGGQHRSVYSADALARHLTQKYGVKVVLNHIEQERKGWKN